MRRISARAEDVVRRAGVVLVATVSERGHPFVTPLWVVVDRGVLYLSTGAESWAARNVAATGKAVLLVGGEIGAGGEGGLAAATARPALRVHAHGTRERGMAPWRVLLRLTAKYYLARPALRAEWRHRRLWPLRVRYYRQYRGQAGYLRLVPTSAEFVSSS